MPGLGPQHLAHIQGRAPWHSAIVGQHAVTLYNCRPGAYRTRPRAWPRWACQPFLFRACDCLTRWGPVVSLSIDGANQGQKERTNMTRRFQSEGQLFSITKFNDAPSVGEAIQRSPLNFHVEKRPLFNAEGRESRSHCEMVRTDTGEALAVVGVDYEPVQQADARGLGYVQGILDAGLGHIVNVGYTNNGARLFVTVELHFERPLEVQKGDIVAQQVRFINTHDGSAKASAWYDLLRLACLNGMTRPEKSLLFSAAHTKGVHQKLNQARDEFNEKRALLAGEVDELRAFTQRKLIDRNLVRYVREVLQPGAGNDPNAKVRYVDRIVELAHTAPGATPGTLYGGLNALTYWATHERGRSENARQNANIFGTGGRFIQRAADVARAYAPKLPLLLAA
jgi:hypothetical protein